MDETLTSLGNAAIALPHAVCGGMLAWSACRRRWAAGSPSLHLLAAAFLLTGAAVHALAAACALSSPPLVFLGLVRGVLVLAALPWMVGGVRALRDLPTREAYARALADGRRARDVLLARVESGARAALAAGRDLDEMRAIIGDIQGRDDLKAEALRVRALMHDLRNRLASGATDPCRPPSPTA